jgi:hypothetical protein
MMDVDTLKQLIDNAEHGKPELTEALVNFPGFSAPKVRRLLNALCSQSDARYLEIGVHTGSTLIPALYGNQAQATCIDSWRMFDGAREQFRKNLDQFLPNRQIEVVDQDCFGLDLSALRTSFNVYFYDGAHDAKSQYQGIIRYAPCLDRRFVLLVDDFNWEEPRNETARALMELKYHMLYEVVLPGAYNGDAAGWWNGLYVGLIEK